MEFAIQAEGLKKRFGDHEVLAGVDLCVPPGTVLGLLGPNGAGKTTTVRTLATLLTPDGGRATVAGHDVVRSPKEVRRRIGLAGQYAAVDELLTGRENLVLIGRLMGLGRRGARERAAELLDGFGLEHAADRPSKTYSGGMRRRLDLAACLVASPEVLFLDEPTTGLDPASRITLWQQVREQVARGVTVLLTTQYLEEADYLADRITVFGSGRVIAEGTADELKRKVGEERLEVGVVGADDLGAAAAALGRAVSEAPVVDRETRTVAVRLADGIGGVARAAAELERSGVAVTDFAVRRPSLDEVFLQLTGASARTDRAEESGDE
ncbi:ATP-binding cassette domain-containing protein [Streptomyces sp. NPDC058417]|uniref:ATP-binding cassette domain-containing protein n=1 Tax=unclassified Streptomyces TaxID=2593676 RepID=UPI0036493816